MNSFWKKTIIKISTFAVLFIAVIAFLLIPQYNSLENDKKLFAEKKSTIEINNKKITSLENVSKDSAQFNKIFDNVNKLWPDSLNVSEFMVQTEGLAKDSNLVIDGFSMVEKKAGDKKESKDKKKISGTQFSLTFKTNYPDLLGFITKMENMARLSTINSINISSDQNLGITLTGEIFNGN